MSTISRSMSNTVVQGANFWVGRLGVRPLATPSLSADVEVRTLTQWLKRPGGRVECGDLVAPVDTTLRSNGMAQKPEPAPPQPPPEVPPRTRASAPGTSSRAATCAAARNAAGTRAPAFARGSRRWKFPSPRQAAAQVAARGAGRLMRKAIVAAMATNARSRTIDGHEPSRLAGTSLKRPHASMPRKRRALCGA